MGVSAKASKEQNSSNNWQNANTNTNTNTTGTSDTQTSNNSILNALTQAIQQSQQQTQQQQTGSTRATFDNPAASSILGSLSGVGSSGNANADASSKAFGSFTSGGVSPYTEDIIKSSNAEADKNFASRLAQTRAQGYRGGTAANLGRQGQLAADFTNQQAGQNAQLRQGAYDAAQTNKLGAANGLGSLANNQQGLGAQLLAVLRGESTTGTGATTSSGVTQNQQTNQQQGTDTGTSSTQSTQQIIQQIIAALTGGSSGTQTGSSGGFSFGTG